MIAEVTSGTANQTAMFMKYGDHIGAHIATNKALTGIKYGCDAQSIFELVTDWTQTASNDAEGLWSNWQVCSVFKNSHGLYFELTRNHQNLNIVNILILPIVYIFVIPCAVYVG